MARERADLLLVKRGLFESRAKARAAIEAGGVTADGQLVARAAELIDEAAEITAAPAHPWVGRGALKLDHALGLWPIAVAGRTVLDVGASLRQRQGLGQRLGEADEADVTDHKADGVVDQGAIEGAGVGRLQVDDPRVALQIAMELAPADVDGVDPRGAALQADLAEAAGGGADIQHGPAGDCNRP